MIFLKVFPKSTSMDNKPAQGFGLVYEGRLVCFYSYECDLGDGWKIMKCTRFSDAHLRAIKRWDRISCSLFLHKPVLKAENDFSPQRH
jgi:hypothetical protein